MIAKRIVCTYFIAFVFFNAATQDASLLSLSPRSLQHINGMHNPEIQAVLKKAEEEAKKLEQNTQQRIANLQEKAEGKVSKIHEQVEERITDALNNADATSEKIRTDAQQFAEKLRQKAETEEKKIEEKIRKEAIIINTVAAEQILGMINQAEEKALELRAKAREEVVKKKIQDMALHLEFFAPTTPYKQPLQKISPEWKNKVQQEFDRNIATLKSIILETEEPEQADDLASTLLEQSTWFDNTLRSAEYVHDLSYDQINQKNDLFNKLMLTHKKAVEYFNILATVLNISDSERKKVQLALLYEVSTLIPKQATIFVPNTDDAMKRLVVRTVQELTKPINPELYDLSTENLLAKINEQTSIKVVQQELSSTLNRLEQIKQEKKALTQQMRQSLEEKGVETLEAELLLRQSQDEMKIYKEKVQQLELAKKVDAALSEKTFTNKLEEARKANLELQLTLEKTNQEINRIQQETSERIRTDLKKRFIPILEEKEKTNLELELIIQDTKKQAQHLGIRLEEAEKVIQETDEAKYQAFEQAEQEKQDSLDTIEHQAAERIKQLQQEQQAAFDQSEQAMLEAENEAEGIALQNQIALEEATIKAQLTEELAEHSVQDQKVQLTQQLDIKPTIVGEKMSVPSIQEIEDKNRRELEKELQTK